MVPVLVIRDTYLILVRTLKPAIPSLFFMIKNLNNFVNFVHFLLKIHSRSEVNEIAILKHRLYAFLDVFNSHLSQFAFFSVRSFLSSQFPQFTFFSIRSFLSSQHCISGKSRIFFGHSTPNAQSQNRMSKKGSSDSRHSVK